jgi:hypothetical protein
MILSLMLALASAPPAAPPPPTGEIVVTGRRAADPATVRQYVNSITQRSDQQVARFHSDICPVAIGLNDAAALVIEDRIRETAVGIGATAAPTRKCDANLVLIIADDGGDLVRYFRAKRPDWLAGLSTVQIRKLINEPSAARAWSVASLRNEDGMKMGQTGANNPPGLAEVPMMRVMSASIINLPTRADIEGSVIVINKAAVVGLSLAQIADYAAMRGLARTRPPSTNRIGTILGLFASGEGTPPLELTGADIAYLRSLYSSSGRASAVDERNRIARELTKR